MYLFVRSYTNSFGTQYIDYWDPTKATVVTDYFDEGSHVVPQAYVNQLNLERGVSNE